MSSNVKNIFSNLQIEKKIKIVGQKQLSVLKVMQKPWFFDPFYLTKINSEFSSYFALNSLFILGWRQFYYYYNWELVNNYLFQILRIFNLLISKGYFALFFDQRYAIYKKIILILKYYNYPVLMSDFVPGTFSNKSVVYYRRTKLKELVFKYPNKIFLIIFSLKYNLVLAKEARDLEIPIIGITDHVGYYDFIIPCAENTGFSCVHFFITNFLLMFENSTITNKITSKESFSSSSIEKKRKRNSLKKKLKSLLYFWTRKKKKNR